MGRRLLACRTPRLCESDAPLSFRDHATADEGSSISIASAVIGIQPDSIAIAPNGQHAVIANEAEGVGIGLHGGPGSLSIVDLTGFNGVQPADLTVQTITLPSLAGTPGFSTERTDDIARLPVDNTPNTVVDRTGRFFVTADEGDTRNAAGSSGPRGGRTVSVFDADTGILLGDTGSQIDDAAAAAGLYPDGRSNRGGSEPEVVDLTHYRGRDLVAVGLERANAVALIDVTDPSSPIVVDIAAVGVGPEGIKFFRVGSMLFVAAANEVSGTVWLLQVTFWISTEDLDASPTRLAREGLKRLVPVK